MLGLVPISDDVLASIEIAGLVAHPDERLAVDGPTILCSLWISGFFVAGRYYKARVEGTRLTGLALLVRVPGQRRVDRSAATA